MNDAAKIRSVRTEVTVEDIHIKIEDAGKHPISRKPRVKVTVWMEGLGEKSLTYDAQEFTLPNTLTCQVDGLRVPLTIGENGGQDE